MAAHNTTSAYRLAEREAQQPQRKPELQVVRSKNKRFITTLVNTRTVGGFALAMTTICFMVYNQACLTEVTGEISDLKAQLNEYESESLRLNSALDSTVSLRSVSEQAQEMGLQRRDQYQTVYVNVYQEDQIALSEEAPAQGFGEKLKHTVNSTAKRIKEYIGSL